MIERELQRMPPGLNLGSPQGRNSNRASRVAHHVSSTPSVVGLSDIGRTRARNEDSLFVVPHLGVAVVADGMGGHPGGDVASRIAAETAAHVLVEALALPPEKQPVSAHMRDAMSRSVERAHQGIRAQGLETPELDGMGTTLTAMVVDVASLTYVLGHVGDSRAYRFRGGELVQLTRDDTWVQERIEAQQLTPEEGRHHPFGHLLTQCLGLDEPPVPHILDGDVEPGDAYLLCTDGLVGMLDDEQLTAILADHLARNGSAGDEAPVRALLDAANEAGGHDNITAALVHFREE